MLFVYGLTPVGNLENGGRYFISRNNMVDILDASGEPVCYMGIAPGTIVDIKFNGTILLSDPGIIPLATVIQVVEE
ncbi:MAG: hypothetical protein FWE42_03035 [Defluviitaleaceae bacterium]|nr:hypothetical protein [Defluviitaleaceae bacterium]